MTIDANELPEGHVHEADLCIVGGGVAGLTLARELAGLNVDICVLEQGGVAEEADAQRLHRGEVGGYPYWGLDYARQAQVGGAGNRWYLDLADGRVGARFRPLDAIDFERRDGVPHSGWPFSKSELDPYYERAHKHLHLGPYTYNPEAWLREEETLLFEGAPSLETVVFQYGPRDLFLDRKDISEARNVALLYHAHATSLEMTDDGGSITSVQGHSLGGKAFTVRARDFVLALGGIENARLLLVSNQTNSKGIGNDNDLVGRYFMEHVHLHTALLWPPDSSFFYQKDRFYHTHVHDGTSIHGKLALSDEVLRREHLRNSCFMLLPMADPGDIVHSKAVDIVREFKSTLERGYLPNDFVSKLGTFIANSGPALQFAGRKLWKRLLAQGGQGHQPPSMYRFHHFGEQAPNPNSRVRLSDRRKDRFGQPVARLEWQMSSDDVQDILRGLEIIKSDVERSGKWRLEVPDYDSLPPAGIRGGFHHMGTTRMHRDPKRGVVNQNSRVHGVSNLFVTGSSVFPTGGYANPTLTIVAMAIRLADHLKSRDQWGKMGLDVKHAPHSFSDEDYRGTEPGSARPIRNMTQLAIDR